MRLAALAESPEAFGSTLAREEAFQETDWRSRLNNGASFLAYRDGEAVGLAGGFYPENDTSPHLVAMWVVPEVRGEGVADAIVEAVVEWAHSGGADRIFLWVIDSNERALAFYRRCGFVDTGARQPLPRQPGITEIEMARTLN